MSAPLRHFFLAAALWACLTPLAEDASAQVGLRIRLAPHGGIVDPRGSVPMAGFIGDIPLTFPGLDPSIAVGASLEIGLRTLPIALRLSGQRSPRDRQMFQLGCPPGPPCFIAGWPVSIPAEASIATLGLDVVGHLVVDRRVTVHPALGIGWASYRYHFSWDHAVLPDLEPGQADVRTDGRGLRAGLGLSAELIRGARLRGEWSELLTRGRDDRSRTHAARLSSFTLGMELMVRR